MLMQSSIGVAERFPKHGRWPQVYCVLAEGYVKASKCVAGRKADKHIYCAEKHGSALMRRDTPDQSSRVKVTRTGPVSSRAKLGDRKHKRTIHMRPDRRTKTGYRMHIDPNDEAAKHAFNR